ncbi:MAG: hypothetical protein PVJ75_08160 [Chloroflexota bacterium]
MVNIVAGLSLLIHRPFLLGDQLYLNAPTGAEIETVARRRK